MGEVLILNILHNVPYIALQNATKHLNRMGADALIAFEPGDLSGADVVLFNQCVLSNALAFHNRP